MTDDALSALAREIADKVLALSPHSYGPEWYPGRTRDEASALIESALAQQAERIRQEMAADCGARLIRTYGQDAAELAAEVTRLQAELEQARKAVGRAREHAERAHAEGADLFDRAEQAERALEQARTALRQLMKEAAAMLALAEPEMREVAGHTNVSVLRLRVDEAAEALSLCEEGSTP